MDVQAALKQLQQQLEQLVAQVQAQPLGVPAGVALGGLLLAIFLFWNVAKAAAKKERTGTVYQAGVRRTTRCVLTTGRCKRAPGRPDPAPLPHSIAGSTSRRSSTTPTALRRPRRPGQR